MSEKGERRQRWYIWDGRRSQRRRAEGGLATDWGVASVNTKGRLGKMGRRGKKKPPHCVLAVGKVAACVRIRFASFSLRPLPVVACPLRIGASSSHSTNPSTFRFREQILLCDQSLPLSSYGGHLLHGAFLRYMGGSLASPVLPACVPPGRGVFSSRRNEPRTAAELASHRRRRRLSDAGELQKALRRTV